MTRLTCPLILLAALLSAGLAATRDPANLVVHEWGTFTSVAGPDGVPVEWWTPGGAQDLPCFVHRLGIPKANWMGTVRMETPVVYFYSPQATAVDVTVRFRQGLISEWFPRAKLSPDRFERVFATPGASHVVEWSNVKVVPAPTAAYPEEAAPSHYYAARQTDAATLEVDGAREKFLFYRGVGRFTVPIAAVEGGDGRIHVRHGGADAIPAVVLFEHRAGKIGYRVHSGLSGGLVLDRPSLDGSHRQLARDLTAILTRHGLYEKEAQAMVDTWRDSWFEKGTRLFYIVPTRFVDRVLPLEVRPRPSQVSRVFVGRLEILTAATLGDVSAAIDGNDGLAALEYGRFLPTIVDRLFPGRPDDERRVRANRVLQPVYARMAAGAPACAVPGTAAQSQ